MNRYLILYKNNELGPINQTEIQANTSSKAEEIFYDLYSKKPLNVTLLESLDYKKENNKNNKIQVGDYVEGYEKIGILGKARKMRGTVINVYVTPDDEIYAVYIIADDFYHGKRNTLLLAELGDIRQVKYDNSWLRYEIENANQLSIEVDNANRTFREKDIVEDNKGVRYIIIGITSHKEDGRKIVVFQRYTDGKLFYEHLVDFVSIDSIGNAKYKIVDRENNFKA